MHIFVRLFKCLNPLKNSTYSVNHCIGILKRTFKHLLTNQIIVLQIDVKINLLSAYVIQTSFNFSRSLYKDSMSE